MTSWKLIMIIGLCFAGLSGCSSAGLLTSVKPSSWSEPSLVSAQDHLEQADKLEEDLARLEAQVSRIDQKVARYEKPPYLDPKRFRQDGLKILRGSNRKEMETLQEKVAWHRAEASRLAGLESTNPEESLGREDIDAEQASLADSEVMKGKQLSQISNDVTSSS